VGATNSTNNEILKKTELQASKINNDLDNTLSNDLKLKEKGDKEFASATKEPKSTSYVSKLIAQFCSTNKRDPKNYKNEKPFAEKEDEEVFEKIVDKNNIRPYMFFVEEESFKIIKIEQETDKISIGFVRNWCLQLVKSVENNQIPPVQENLSYKKTSFASKQTNFNFNFF